MAIGATYRNEYLGDGTLAAYDYTFKIHAATHLRVTEVDDDGGETVLTYPGHYTVDGVGSPLGGTVTLSDELTDGYSLIIERAVPFTQTTDLRNQSEFLPKTHEDTFDRLTMQAQRLYSLALRTLRVREGLSLGDVDLELPDPVAGKVIGWNAAGTGLVNLDTDAQSFTGADGDITHLQAGSGADSRTVNAKLREIVSAGDFSVAQAASATVNATGFAEAVAYATSVGATVLLRAGTYTVREISSHVNAAGTVNYIADIVSGMRVEGEVGAVLKMEDGRSTSGTPKRLSFFSSNAHTSNWSIRNVTFDCNWENNKINPQGGPWSNGYTQAPISVSGDSGRADDVLIENCTFKNHGGTCCVVAGQSNAAATVLGKRWTVRNNVFHNVGMNSTDFSGMFAWIDECEFSGNTLFNDAAPVLDPGASDWGKGLLELYEVHGSHHRLLNNTAWNSNEGFRISGNYTSTVRDCIIAGNMIDALGYGVVFDFLLTGVPQPMIGSIDSVIISGNIFRIGDAGGYYAGNGTLQSAIQITTELGPSNVTITGNHFHKSGTDDASALVQLGNLPTTTTGPSNIVIQGNTVQGATFGVYMVSQDAAGIGRTVIKGNTWNGLLAAAGSSPMGLYVATPTGAVTLLEYSGNSTNTATYGIYLDSATITTFYLGPNEYNTIATAEYSETGSTITNRRGFWSNITFTPTLAAVTLGNGTVTGQYSVVNDKLVKFTATLTVGATTSFSGAGITFTLPFTALNSNSQFYFGSGAVYDLSGVVMTTLAVQVGAGGTTAELRFTTGPAVTGSAPYTLATGDTLYLDVTYARA